jgi:hypothetical protein
MEYKLILCKSGGTPHAGEGFCTFKRENSQFVVSFTDKVCLATFLN